MTRQITRWGLPYPDSNRPLARRSDQKPHLIYYNGRWRLFRNWWKATWSYLHPHNPAAALSGETIDEVRTLVEHCHDYRFGGRT